MTIETQTSKGRVFDGGEATTVEWDDQLDSLKRLREIELIMYEHLAFLHEMLSIQNTPKSVQTEIGLIVQAPFSIKNKFREVFDRKKFEQELRRNEIGKAAALSIPTGERARSYVAVRNLVGSADVDSYFTQLMQEWVVLRNEIVRANYAFVCGIALQYTQDEEELEEAKQEGSLGLMRAVEKFDPERGYKFLTFAGHDVRQRIGRALKQSRAHLRTPVGVLEIIGAFKKAFPEWAKMSADEIAIARGISLRRAKDFLIDMNRESLMLELDDDLETDDGEQDGAGRHDMVEDTSHLPVEMQAELGMMKIWIQELVEKSKLKPAERRVLDLRHGLDSERKYCVPLEECAQILFEEKLNNSIDEQGKEIPISRERVRQIEAKALRLVRALAFRKHRQKGADFLHLSLSR